MTARLSLAPGAAVTTRVEPERLTVAALTRSQRLAWEVRTVSSVSPPATATRVATQGSGEAPVGAVQLGAKAPLRNTCTLPGVVPAGISEASRVNLRPADRLRLQRGR